MTKTFQKIVSAGTIFFFLATNTVWGMPQAGIEVFTQRETPGFFHIEIPENLASLEEIYEAPAKPDPRLILHIQNAHGNYEAQTKIKDLLDYLYKTYGFKLIFVEGAAEQLNAEYLKLFPDAERNNQLADSLAQKGELTGSELYLMDAPSDVRAVGIEKTDLYRANYEAFKKVYAVKSDSDNFLAGINAKLERLASRFYSPEARRLLSEWTKFEEGHRDFLPYAKRLALDAKKILNLDLESIFAQVEWPQMTRLLVLQSMETDLNRSEALKEKTKLLEFLKSKQVSKSILESIETFEEKKITMNRVSMDEQAYRNSPRYLLERLVGEAGPKGFYFHDYPAFSLYAGYLILKSELDSRNLFKEIELVFDKILTEVTKTELEKNLLELYRDEKLLTKLLHLELTRDDWQRSLYRRDWIKPETMTRRIQHLEKGNISIDMLKEPEDKEVKPISEIFDTAFKFYDLARERESVFYQTMRETMASQKAEKAVLITGGFHTDGLMELFRQDEVSFGILMPRLAQKPENDNYIATMMETHQTLFDIANIEMAQLIQRSETRVGQGTNARAEVRNMVDAVLETYSRSPNTNLEDLGSVLTHVNGSAYAQDRGLEFQETRSESRRNTYQVAQKGESEVLLLNASETPKGVAFSALRSETRMKVGDTAVIVGGKLNESMKKLGGQLKSLPTSTVRSEGRAAKQKAGKPQTQIKGKALRDLNENVGALVLAYLPQPLNWFRPNGELAAVTDPYSNVRKAAEKRTLIKAGAPDNVAEQLVQLAEFFANKTKIQVLAPLSLAVSESFVEEIMSPRSEARISDTESLLKIHRVLRDDRNKLGERDGSNITLNGNVYPLIKFVSYVESLEYLSLKNLGILIRSITENQPIPEREREPFYLDYSKLDKQGNVRPIFRDILIEAMKAARSEARSFFEYLDRAEDFAEGQMNTLTAVAGRNVGFLINILESQYFLIAAVYFPMFVGMTAINFTMDLIVSLVDRNFPIKDPKIVETFAKTVTSHPGIKRFKPILQKSGTPLADFAKITIVHPNDPAKKFIFEIYFDASGEGNYQVLLYYMEGDNSKIEIERGFLRTSSMGEDVQARADRLISDLKENPQWKEFKQALPRSEVRSVKSEKWTAEKQMGKDFNASVSGGLRSDRQSLLGPLWTGLQESPFYSLLSWRLSEGYSRIASVTRRIMENTNPIFQGNENSPNSRVASPAVPMNWLYVMAISGKLNVASFSRSEARASRLGDDFASTPAGEKEPVTFYLRQDNHLELGRDEHGFAWGEVAFHLDEKRNIEALRKVLELAKVNLDRLAFPSEETPRLIMAVDPEDRTYFPGILFFHLPSKKYYIIDFLGSPGEKPGTYDFVVPYMGYFGRVAMVRDKSVRVNAEDFISLPAKVEFILNPEGRMANEDARLLIQPIGLDSRGESKALDPDIALIEDAFQRLERLTRENILTDDDQRTINRAVFPIRYALGLDHINFDPDKSQLDIIENILIDKSERSKIIEGFQAWERLISTNRPLAKNYLMRFNSRSETRAPVPGTYWMAPHIKIHDTQTIAPDGELALLGSYEVLELENADVMARGLGLDLQGDIEAFVGVWKTKERIRQPLFLQVFSGPSTNQRAYSFYADPGTYDENIMNSFFTHFPDADSNAVNVLRMMRMLVSGQISLNRAKVAAEGNHVGGMTIETTGWIHSFVDHDSEITLGLDVEKDSEVKEEETHFTLDDFTIARKETYDSSLKPFDGGKGQFRYRALYFSNSDAADIAEFLELSPLKAEAVLVFWNDHQGHDIPLFLQITTGDADQKTGYFFNIANPDYIKHFGTLFFDERSLSQLVGAVKTANPKSSPATLWRNDFNLSRARTETPDALNAFSLQKRGNLTQLDLGDGRSINDLKAGDNLPKIGIVLLKPRSETRADKAWPSQDELQSQLAKSGLERFQANFESYDEEKIRYLLEMIRRIAQSGVMDADVVDVVVGILRAEKPNYERLPGISILADDVIINSLLPLTLEGRQELERRESKRTENLLTTLGLHYIVADDHSLSRHVLVQLFDKDPGRRGFVRDRIDGMTLEEIGVFREWLNAKMLTRIHRHLKEHPNDRDAVSMAIVLGEISQSARWLNKRLKRSVLKQYESDLNSDALQTRLTATAFFAHYSRKGFTDRPEFIAQLKKMVEDSREDGKVREYAFRALGRNFHAVETSFFEEYFSEEDISERSLAYRGNGELINRIIEEFFPQTALRKQLIYSRQIFIVAIFLENAIDPRFIKQEPADIRISQASNFAELYEIVTGERINLVVAAEKIVALANKISSESRSEARAMATGAIWSKEDLDLELKNYGSAGMPVSGGMEGHWNIYTQIVGNRAVSIEEYLRHDGSTAVRQSITARVREWNGSDFLNGKILAEMPLSQNRFYSGGLNHIPQEAPKIIRKMAEALENGQELKEVLALAHQDVQDVRQKENYLGKLGSPFYHIDSALENEGAGARLVDVVVKALGKKEIRSPNPKLIENYLREILPLEFDADLRPISDAAIKRFNAARSETRDRKEILHLNQSTKIGAMELKVFAIGQHKNKGYRRDDDKSWPLNDERFAMLSISDTGVPIFSSEEYDEYVEQARRADSNASIFSPDFLKALSSLRSPHKDSLSMKIADGYEIIIGNSLTKYQNIVIGVRINEKNEVELEIREPLTRSETRMEEEEVTLTFPKGESSVNHSFGEHYRLEVSWSALSEFEVNVQIVDSGNSYETSVARSIGAGQTVFSNSEAVTATLLELNRTNRTVRFKIRRSETRMVSAGSGSRVLNDQTVLEFLRGLQSVDIHEINKRYNQHPEAAVSFSLSHSSDHGLVKNQTVAVHRTNETPYMEDALVLDTGVYKIPIELVQALSDVQTETRYENVDIHIHSALIPKDEKGLEADTGLGWILKNIRTVVPSLIEISRMRTREPWRKAYVLSGTGIYLRIGSRENRLFITLTTFEAIEKQDAQSGHRPVKNRQISQITKDDLTRFRSDREPFEPVLLDSKFFDNNFRLMSKFKPQLIWALDMIGEIDSGPNSDKLKQRWSNKLREVEVNIKDLLHAAGEPGPVEPQNVNNVLLSFVSAEDVASSEHLIEYLREKGYTHIVPSVIEFLNAISRRAAEFLPRSETRMSSRWNIFMSALFSAAGLMMQSTPSASLPTFSPPPSRQMPVVPPPPPQNQKPAESVTVPAPVAVDGPEYVPPPQPAGAPSDKPLAKEAGEPFLPLQTFEGHTNAIEAIAISPDGEIMITGSRDGSARVWNINSGKSLWVLNPNPERGIYTVAFSPDGKEILTAGNDNKVHVWDIKSQKLVKTLEVSEWVLSAVFSPDGKQIVTGSWDATKGKGSVQVWDKTSGKLVRSLELPAEAQGATVVIFSPDGKQIITGSWDGMVRVWDNALGKLQKTLVHSPNTAEEKEWVTSIAFSPDGKQMATAGTDKIARIWNWNTRLVSNLIQSPSEIQSVVFSSDGKEVITGGWDGSARVWEPVSGQQMDVLSGRQGQTKVAVTPDRKRIITGHRDGTVKLWLRSEIRTDRISRLEDLVREADELVLSDDPYRLPELKAEVLKELKALDHEEIPSEPSLFDRFLKVLVAISLVFPTDVSDAEASSLTNIDPSLSAQSILLLAFAELELEAAADGVSIKQEFSLEQIHKELLNHKTKSNALRSIKKRLQKGQNIVVGPWKSLEDFRRIQEAFPGLELGLNSFPQSANNPPFVILNVSEESGSRNIFDNITPYKGHTHHFLVPLELSSEDDDSAKNGVGVDIDSPYGGKTSFVLAFGDDGHAELAVYSPERPFWVIERDDQQKIAQELYKFGVLASPSVKRSETRSDTTDNDDAWTTEMTNLVHMIIEDPALLALQATFDIDINGFDGGSNVIVTLPVGKGKEKSIIKVPIYIFQPQDLTAPGWKDAARQDVQNSLKFVYAVHRLTNPDMPLLTLSIGDNPSATFPEVSGDPMNRLGDITVVLGSIRQTLTQLAKSMAQKCSVGQADCVSNAFMKFEGPNILMFVAILRKIFRNSSDKEADQRTEATILKLVGSLLGLKAKDMERGAAIDQMFLGAEGEIEITRSEARATPMGWNKIPSMIVNTLRAGEGVVPGNNAVYYINTNAENILAAAGKDLSKAQPVTRIIKKGDINETQLENLLTAKVPVRREYRLFMGYVTIGKEKIYAYIIAPLRPSILRGNPREFQPKSDEDVYITTRHEGTDQIQTIVEWRTGVSTGRPKRREAIEVLTAGGREDAVAIHAKILQGVRTKIRGEVQSILMEGGGKKMEVAPGVRQIRQANLTFKVETFKAHTSEETVRFEFRPLDGKSEPIIVLITTKQPLMASRVAADRDDLLANDLVKKIEAREFVWGDDRQANITTLSSIVATFSKLGPIARIIRSEARWLMRDLPLNQTMNIGDSVAVALTKVGSERVLRISIPPGMSIEWPERLNPEGSSNDSTYEFKLRNIGVKDDQIIVNRNILIKVNEDYSSKRISLGIDAPRNLKISHPVAMVETSKRSEAREIEPGIAEGPNIDVPLGFNGKLLFSLAGKLSPRGAVTVVSALIIPSAEASTEVPTQRAEVRAMALAVSEIITPDSLLNLKPVMDQFPVIFKADDLPGAVQIATTRVPARAELRFVGALLAAKRNQLVEYTIAGDDPLMSAQVEAALAEARSEWQALYGDDFRSRSETSYVATPRMAKTLQLRMQALPRKLHQRLIDQEISDVPNAGDLAQENVVLLIEPAARELTQSVVVMTRVLESTFTDADMKDPLMIIAENFSAVTLSRHTDPAKINELTQSSINQVSRSDNRWVTTAQMKALAGVMKKVMEALNQVRVRIAA
ncbi:MAG: WD40 repeat domain-containing protein [Candidatus Omnitrophica bacterium]|nr:WD40 repeat domain-containing protein [Candidatus Omnitrophota bacterium]